MDIVVAAIGRARDGAEAALARGYLDRLAKSGRPIGITDVALRELPEARAATAGLRKDDEAARLLALRGGRARLIALDERGKALTSRDFAGQIAWHRDEGAAALIFALGGPDGHGRTLLRAADATVSLGAMTWPHLLARVLVAEQLYRAGSILAGHPYHRD